MAFWLLLGGTIGTFAAALTGGWAEESLTMSKTLHESVEQHETVGYILVWLYACLLVWKILRRHQMAASENRTFFGALLVATALLVYSGSLGGELVYEFGAGVKGVTIDLPLKDLPLNKPNAPLAP
jgi:uncharacterized membrane protein